MLAASSLVSVAVAVGTGASAAQAAAPMHGPKVTKVKTSYTHSRVVWFDGKDKKCDKKDPHKCYGEPGTGGLGEADDEASDTAAPVAYQDPWKKKRDGDIKKKKDTVTWEKTIWFGDKKKHDKKKPYGDGDGDYGDGNYGDGDGDYGDAADDPAVLAGPTTAAPSTAAAPTTAVAPTTAADPATATDPAGFSDADVADGSDLGDSADLTVPVGLAGPGQVAGPAADPADPGNWNWNWNKHIKKKKDTVIWKKVVWFGDKDRKHHRYGDNDDDGYPGSQYPGDNAAGPGTGQPVSYDPEHGKHRKHVIKKEISYTRERVLWFSCKRHGHGGYPWVGQAPMTATADTAPAAPAPAPVA